jgi:cytochrome c
VGSRSRVLPGAFLIAALLPAGSAMAQGAGHAGPVSALAANEEALLSGGFDGRAIVWVADGTSARHVARFHDGNVTAVALLPGGGFATGGQDGRVAIWVADGQTPLRATPHGVSPVSALAVAETRIAAGYWDGRIAVIDLAVGEAREVQAHEGRVSGLAFLPSGDLVSVGADLRFTRRGVDLSPLASSGLPDLPNGLARAGDRLAVIFAEGALRLFSADGEMLPERFLSERPLVAVAATSGTVAAAAVDGAIWLLEPGTLELRAGIEGGAGPVWALALAGETLFAGSATGPIDRYAARDGSRLGGSGSAAGDDFHDGSRGAEVWRACAVCHSLEPGDHARAGPSLHGIFGRAIASAEGYGFSPALRELDIVWTPETVAELFEVGPEIYTPGSRMPDQRVADPADRQALVEFLDRASR